MQSAFVLRRNRVTFDIGAAGDWTPQIVARIRYLPLLRKEVGPLIRETAGRAWAVPNTRCGMLPRVTAGSVAVEYIAACDEVPEGAIGFVGRNPVSPRMMTSPDFAGGSAPAKIPALRRTNSPVVTNSLTGYWKIAG